MADASATPNNTHPLPFVARAQIAAFFSRTHNAVTGAVITYFDQAGRRIGASLSGLDEVERHAHDLLAAVHAARAVDPAVVPIGLLPRSDSILMPDLSVGEAA